jgi:hypothetical protein
MQASLRGEATICNLQGSPGKSALGADSQSHCECNQVERMGSYNRKQDQILSGKLPCPQEDELR